MTMPTAEAETQRMCKLLIAASESRDHRGEHFFGVDNVFEPIACAYGMSPGDGIFFYSDVVPHRTQDMLAGRTAILMNVLGEDDGPVPGRAGNAGAGGGGGAVEVGAGGGAWEDFE